MKSKRTKELYAQYVESFKRDAEDVVLEVAKTVEHWTGQKVVSVIVETDVDLEADEKPDLPRISIEIDEEPETTFRYADDDFFDGIIIIADGKYGPVSLSTYMKEKLQGMMELGELFEDTEFVFNIEESKVVAHFGEKKKWVTLNGKHYPLC